MINISLGGSDAGPELVAALGRATAAGVVIVIAAGNDGMANPDAFALAGTDPTIGNGAYIIAGAVDQNNNLASFTNKAGTAQNIYLAALGVGVLSIGTGGQQFLFDGTSYSTPAIAGAAALLAGAFPNLTGRQIVDLLLTSATDAGVAGTDDQFGRGILSIANAFAPKGTASLPGSAVPVSLATNGALGGALGTAPKLRAALSGVIVLDGYGRAYRTDLGRTLVGAPRAGLAGALLSSSQSVTVGSAAHRLSLTVDPGANSSPSLGFGQRGLDAHGNAGTPQVALVHSRLWAGGKVDAGVGLGLDGLENRERVQFFAAPDNGLTPAVAHVRAGALSFQQGLGSWSATIGADSVRAVAPLRVLASTVTSEWRMGVARELGAAHIAASWSGRDEHGGLLGAALAPVFGIASAHTQLAGVDADVPLGPWRASFAVRRGWTHARLAPGLIAGLSRVQSYGWHIDLAREGLIKAGDAFTVRLAQPMRVVGGTARLLVPDGYDYFTHAAHFAERFAAVAPDGTERDLEAVYTRRFRWAQAEAHVFRRADAGDILGAEDNGVAVTLVSAF